MSEQPTCISCGESADLYAVRLWWLNTGDQPAIHELPPTHVCEDCSEEVHLNRWRLGRHRAFLSLLVLTTLFAAGAMLTYFSFTLKWNIDVFGRRLALGAIGAGYLVALLTSGKWLLGGRNRSRTIAAAHGLRQRFRELIPQLVPGSEPRDFDPAHDQLTTRASGSSPVEDAPASW